MSHRGRETADSALLLALVRGATVEQAAREARISRRTAQRRLDDHAFVERLREAQDAAYREGLGNVAAGFTQAVGKLRQLMQTGSERTQLQAARALLANAPRIREGEELETRLAELERRLGDESE